MISRGIWRIGVGVVVLSALSHASSANAMNWCALPSIITVSISEFEQISSKVELSTGCSRQPTDSAHIAIWLCEDDKATIDVDERVGIQIAREPGKSINLLLITQGMQNLDKIRSCGLKNVANIKNFDPGNVLLKDQMRIGSDAVITLTNSPIDELSVIISDTYRLTGSGDWSKQFWLELYGISTKDYASTEVRFAGLDPLNTDIYTLVDAYKSRQSKVNDSKSIGTNFPEWTLSAPIGLAGVKSVHLKGFMKQFLRLDYSLNSTSDYQNYVNLLDAEYGTSTRRILNKCTLRDWKSGDVEIVGSFCADDEIKLSFINAISVQQLSDYLRKSKQDISEAEKKTNKIPTIDRDMF